MARRWSSARASSTGQLGDASNERTQVVARDQARGAGRRLLGLVQRVRNRRAAERQILRDLDHGRTVVERIAGAGSRQMSACCDEPKDVVGAESCPAAQRGRAAARGAIGADSVELATAAGHTQPSGRQPVFNDQALEHSGSWRTPSCGSSAPTYTSLGSMRRPGRMAGGRADTVTAADRCERGRSASRGGDGRARAPDESYW